MKPKWVDAPGWAKYLAMDANGDWWWYQKNPEKDADFWYAIDGQACSARSLKPHRKWASTLEKRPPRP